MTGLGVLLMEKAGRRPLLMVKRYIFSELIMSYDHSNMYAAIFQVSAAGTCLGCLLVGFSFLAKVWIFWNWFHPNKVNDLPFADTMSKCYFSLEQEHHWGKDLNILLALAGILVQTGYCLRTWTHCWLWQAFFSQTDIHKTIVLKIFILNQTFGGSFSLGMGGIPWVIMSEVPLLP